jgi:hypothetical protein
VSVLSGYHALVRPVLGAVLAILLVNLVLAVGTPSSMAPQRVAVNDSNDFPCPYNISFQNYYETVQVDGNAQIPKVSLSYTYYASVRTSINGSTPGPSVCVFENGTTVDNITGQSEFVVPATWIDHCSALPGGGRTCANSTGPWGPVNMTLDTPNPPGYLSSINDSHSFVRVLYYPELTAVALDPRGPRATFTAEGVDAVRADPLTAVGTPDPVEPRFNWTLSGVGWTFATPPSGSEAFVTSAAGAAVGNLTVVASQSPSEGGFVAPPESVELAAVATTISSASLNRTVLDVGQAIQVALNGSGAAGYNYTARVDPGLGDPSTAVTCASDPGADEMVSLTCDANLTYPAVGVAQPVVTLSNGNSSAVWPFPEVTVDLAPWVTFLPGTPVGYTNSSVPVTIQAAVGSGASPYARACLAPGEGPIQCSSTPGPTWTFHSVYSKPGNYSTLAWVVDATGENRSVTATVRIVAPLALDLAPISGGWSAGAPIPLSVMVSGGDLPARVWWNATGASNPIASVSVVADGSIRTTYVPPVAGFVTLSVVVVDDLGTEAEASVALSVGVGLATSVDPVVLPTASVSWAGAPLPFAWQALDSVGELVRNFSASAWVELTLAGSDRAVPGWVNASGAGPLTDPLPGRFDLPSTAWIDGTLNLTVTTQLTGTLEVALTVASGLSGGGNTVEIVVLPDIDHLRLFDPRTAVHEGRVNDTLWQVTDRYGNPADGASIVVVSSFGGSSTRTVVPVRSEEGGATGVWVNVSAPASLGGTVTVTDLANEALLPPLVISGPGDPLTALVPWVALLLVASGATAATAVAVRRTRRRPTVEPDASPANEGELQRLAEGLASVVEAVRRAGTVDLAGLESAWEPSPAPLDLADWVASLLTDGTLDATLGSDGVARFFLVSDRAPAAQVTLDVEAFDRAQVRRDEASADWDRNEP